MPEVKNIRAKTCGYCGKPLTDNFYRDYSRTRGFFCSGAHCMKFIENGKMSKVPGLSEDEAESLYDVQQQGYGDYEERDTESKPSRGTRVVAKASPKPRGQTGK